MSIKYEKNSLIDIIKSTTPEPVDYSVSFSNDRSRTKFIKKVEKLIRSSMEYRDYIGFLRENVGMDACAFFNNISKANNKKIRIEVHHAPLTLYDIIKLVLDRTIRTGGEVNCMLLAEEATKIHYMNQVGLIPLSKTLHEVVHNSDKLVIPMYMVYGNFRAFLENFSEELEMSENKHIKAKIQRMIDQTRELNDKSFDVLKEKFTYITVDGFEMPVKIEDKEEAKKEIKKEKEKVA